MATLNSSLIRSLIDQACWRNIGVWSKDTTRCEKLETVRHCRNCEVFSEAAKTVFRRESSELEIFERSLDLYHGGELEQSLGKVSVLPFRIGTTWLCTYPTQIVRVAKKSSVHRIPHRETSYIKGLVAVDGAIYTCISLDSILPVRQKPHNERPSSIRPGVFERIMIIQTPKKRLAVEVDEVRSVTYFGENEALEISSACPESLKSFVSKEFCFDKYLNESMYLLDVDTIEQLYYKAIL